MRRFVFAPLMLAACLKFHPYIVTSPAAGDARGCVANKIAALGYEVEYQTPDRNTVRARKGDGAGGIDIVLTATVFSEGGVDQVRVTSEAINYRGSPKEERLGSVGSTRADADAVVAACGRA